MKVSIAQIDIAYGNVSKNYERTANALQKALANHPDVIVLPEMWNTGYALDQLDELADENLSMCNAPECLRNYFDYESWRRDCAFDYNVTSNFVFSL